MKTLILASALMTVSAFAEVHNYPCRSDDYYCLSKNKIAKPEVKMVKAKTLSDKIVPVKEKQPARIEAMSESTGQGIYSGLVQ